MTAAPRDLSSPGAFRPYREVLTIAFPLIVSTGSMSLMNFLDRMFLARYSQDALAACVPAGIASFAAVSFFMGVAGYANTFVAQYHGAGLNRRIGPAVWQAVYFSLGAWFLLLLLYSATPFLMRQGRHAEHLQVLEAQYFGIMVLGGGFPVLCGALSSFFSGRGRTQMIMWTNVGAAALNIVLNYCWIFGRFGFPEWGIRGAAWATLVATGAKVVVYLVLFLLPSHQKEYGTTLLRIDLGLFRRLMRFGLPSGVQFFVDVFAFTFFVFLTGQIGETELAATGAVLSVNNLCFLPLVGLAIATSTLVGRFLGRNRPDLAEGAAGAALRLAMVYMWLFSAIYVLAPNLVLELFRSQQEAQNSAEMLALGRVLLRYVAVFCLLDGVNMIYSAALKGAGDTRFVMWMLGTLSIGIMVIPGYVSVHVFGAGIHGPWSFATSYVCILAQAFYFRFKGGKWKSMRVIEHPPSPDSTVELGVTTEA